MKPPPSPKAFSMIEAAKLLGIETAELHALALGKSIPFTRTTAGWRFELLDLEIASGWIIPTRTKSPTPPRPAA